MTDGPKRYDFVLDQLLIKIKQLLLGKITVKSCTDV